MGEDQAVEKAITKSTKAIVIVHLYGQSANLDKILSIAHKHGLKIIEDCAQSAGARYNGQRLGSFADVSCFSFYPTKNLGAIGDGGLVVTNDPNLADSVRRLRQYGWDDNRVSQIPGSNSRLDELQAAILNVKLKFLDEDNALRRQHARTYDNILSDAGLSPPLVRDQSEHIYHLYVIEVEDQKSFVDQLMQEEIVAAIHYPVPTHQHTAFQNLETPGGMSVTEAITNRIVTLPMYPELPEAAFSALRKVTRA